MADAEETTTVDGEAGGEVEEHHPIDDHIPGIGGGDDSDAGSEGGDESSAPEQRVDVHADPELGSGETQAPIFDEGLLSIAEANGIPRTLALAFESPRELADAITHRKNAAAFQHQGQDVQQTDTQQTEGPQAFEAYKFDDSAFADFYDENDPMLTGMRALNDHYFAQTQQLQQQLGYAWGQIQQIVSADRQRQAADIQRAVDASFDELDSEVYGNSQALTPEARLMRDEVQGHMNALALTYQQMGKPVPPMNVLRDRVLGVAPAPSGGGSSAAGGDGGQPRDKSGRFTARPSSANGTNPGGGRDKALRRAREMHGH